MKLFASVALLLFAAFSATACPWCKKYGITETVTEADKDAGGTFFGKPPPPEKTRHYYVAAEALMWEWVPGGKNTSRDVPLPPGVAARPSSIKAHYVQYTDATFSTRMPDTPQQGLLGPTLRGVAGEYLAVTFLNLTPSPLSMHPHGVRYDKDSEGAWYLPAPGKGAAVGAGARFTYVWHLDESSAPQPGEPSSKCWLYHSHCKDEEEVNMGLAGLIVVTDPARARPDGTPNDVDRELATIFQIFEDEDEELEERVEEGLPPPTFEEAMESQQLGARHAINGRLFGTLQGLEMVEGERVRWYLAALGDETGLHTALLPGETKIADMSADNPGTWLLHCHISDHMMEGMFAPFVVHPRGGKVRGAAFLGSLSGASTVQWHGAAGTLDYSAEATEPAKVTLRAKVPVYRGFFIPKADAAIRIGARSAELGLTENGYTELRAEGVEFRAINANKFGVIQANELEFELTLKGAAWRDALDLKSAAETERKVPFELRLGKASHASSLPLLLKRDGDTLRLEWREP